jgi:type II secretory pathway component PulM
MAIAERARDFWERISPRERRLVVIATIAVPLTIAVWLGLSIRDGLVDMESRNDRLRHAIDTVVDLRARGITAEKDDTLDKMGVELLGLETYLDKAAQKAGITFKGPVTPTGTVNRNGFVTHSVKVDLDDVSIDQLKTFLQEVEQGSKYVAVTHVDLRRDFKSKEKLDLNIEVSTYAKEKDKDKDKGEGSGSATGSADKKGS